MANVVWKPHPGSQTLALTSRASELLLHGSRGGGKTEAQIMRFRIRVGLGYGRFWRGIVIDREYKNLDDIISKTLRWFPKFAGGGKFLSSQSDLKWVWPDGEELLFRHMKHKRDYDAFHGQEFCSINFNELGKHSTPELYDLMKSCNRSSFIPEEHPVIRVVNGEKTVVILPEMPLEMVSTCNPSGAGHNWLKKRWINKAVAGELIKTHDTIYNPRTQQDEEIVKTSVHIFSSYRENPHLSPNYIATLNAIKDPNLLKAWKYGSWDIVSGGMFDAEWDSTQHVLQPFKIPSSWRITRSFDWGSSKPFSVGWWAISDGTDYLNADGVSCATIRGDLFRIAEWYGCGEEPNTGLKMLSPDITKGIVFREIQAGLYGRVMPGPADNSINDVTDGNSIARRMSDPVKIGGKIYPGVTWTRSDKSPGSRVAGWEKMRIMLRDAKIEDGIMREKPGLFVFSNCTHFVDQIPVLPRDEKNGADVDSSCEDHIADEARYMVLSVAKGSHNILTVGHY